MTASHNPAEDSGYKVYGSDGTQIRPPVDQEIESLMDFSDLPGEEDLASQEEIEYLSGSAAVTGYIENVVPSNTSRKSELPSLNGCTRLCAEWVGPPWKQLVQRAAFLFQSVSMRNSSQTALSQSPFSEPGRARCSRRGACYGGRS